MCLYVLKWTCLGKDVQLVIANKHLKVKRDIWAGNKSFRIKEWVVNEGVRMDDIAQEDRSGSMSKITLIQEKENNWSQFI